MPALAGTRLRMELDRIPLWRGDHVAIRQLAEDFARYLYLPRLSDSQVLAAAAQDGLGLLLWNQETFAYADSFDEAAGRYRGLRSGQQIAVSLDSGEGLLVKPDVASKQQAAEAEPEAGSTAGPGMPGQPATVPGAPSGGAPGEPGPTPPPHPHPLLRHRDARPYARRSRRRADRGRGDCPSRRSRGLGGHGDARHFLSILPVVK